MLKVIKFFAQNRRKNIDININTVDAFQGKDADVCIYAVTRSNVDGKLGFQREARRLNVALSRGRDALIIVGDEAFSRRDAVGGVAGFVWGVGGGFSSGRVARGAG